MNQPADTRPFPFYLKLACVLFSLIALTYIVIVAKEILSPMIFSCLFSIMLLPVCRFFELRLRLPRSAASMLSVILLLACLALLFFIIGTQISDLTREWPLFEAQLSKSVANLQDWIASTFHINASKQLNYVHSATNKMMETSSIVVRATLLSLSSLLLFLVFTFIYTFFFLLYRRLIKRFFEHVFLKDNEHIVHDIMQQVQYIIRKYIVGLIIQMVIVSLMTCVVFWIIGVKYALLLGLLTGLFNLIPYIGIFTAMLISSFVTFATAVVATKVLFVVFSLVIIHLIDSNVLLPLVVGSKVRINALIAVLGIIIGEMVWGISGMFLSIPVIAVLKIIFDRVKGMEAWGVILGDEDKKHDLLAGQADVHEHDLPYSDR